MRDLRELDAWRVRTQDILAAYGNFGDETCGVFQLPVGSFTMNCVASSGGGWDHVSVSLPNRCPSWLEMEAVKRSFFRDDETAMQLHVSVARHISFHPYTLHIWRPHNEPIPLPPVDFV